MALNHAAPSVGIDVLASLKSEAYAKSFRGDLREKARPAYTLPDFTKQVQASYIARADSPQKLARTESQPMAYLQQLLGEKSHLPGLDIVAVASGDDFHLCEDWRVSCYCGGCDKEEPEPQVEVVSRPMNHLVFDFNSHQIQVQEWKEAQETHGFFDPCLLWTELAWCLQSVHPSNPLAAPWSITFHVTDGTMTLTRQGSMVAVFLEKSLLKSVSLSEMRFDDQGFLQWPLMPDALGSRVKVPPESQDALRRFLNSSYDCSKLVSRYLISLAPLSSTSSSFHHAGPVCGCSEHVHLEVEHAEIAASDHTDTMLMAVTQSAGHVWLWTIYHGISAL